MHIFQKLYCQFSVDTMGMAVRANKTKGYLVTVVAAAQLQWRRSNMNVIRRNWEVLLQNRISKQKKENQITEKLENVALVTHTRGPLY